MNDDSLIISPTPAAAPAQTDPFQALSDLIMSLATARTKQEAMARLSGCQRLIQLSRQVFVERSRQVGQLRTVLLRATEGTVRVCAIDVKGKEPTSYVFTDSVGEPVWVIDATAGELLITPETVEPIIVEITMRDGTVERVEMKHLGNEADQEPDKPDDQVDAAKAALQGQRGEDPNGPSPAQRDVDCLRRKLAGGRDASDPDLFEDVRRERELEDREPVTLAQADGHSDTDRPEAGDA